MVGAPEEHDDHSDSPRRNSWGKAAAMGALGFEFVGFVLAGVFIGTRIDARYDSEPVGLLVTLALALVSAGWHAYRVTRRFINNGEA